MSRYKTFCAYKGCSNTNCARHYIHAPDNNMCSWFAIRQKMMEHVYILYPKFKKNSKKEDISNEIYKPKGGTPGRFFRTGQ